MGASAGKGPLQVTSGATTNPRRGAVSATTAQNHREDDGWGLDRTRRISRDDDGYTASYTSGEKTTESVPHPARQHHVCALANIASTLLRDMGDLRAVVAAG